MNMMTPVGASSLAPTSTSFYTIPTDPPQPPDPGAPFIPQEIVHAVLTIDGAAPALTFKVLTPPGTPIAIPAGGPDPIEAYVLTAAAAASTQSLNEGPPPGPFDFAVTKPCWVVVELQSPGARWQFTTGEHGVTTKAPPGPVQRHCALRHVYADAIGAAGEPVLSDGCRVLYFGVVSREAGAAPPDLNPGSEYINFHTEFLQDDPVGENDLIATVTRRMRVIFDPDVKNNGGKFPPDPG